MLVRDAVKLVHSLLWSMYLVCGASGGASTLRAQVVAAFIFFPSPPSLRVQRRSAPDCMRWQAVIFYGVRAFSVVYGEV